MLHVLIDLLIQILKRDVERNQTAVSALEMIEEATPDDIFNCFVYG